MRTNTIDGELCTKHRVEASKPKLSVLITKHVDDLKLTGIQEEDIAVSADSNMYLATIIINCTVSPIVEHGIVNMPRPRQLLWTKLVCRIMSHYSSC